MVKCRGPRPFDAGDKESSRWWLMRDYVNEPVELNVLEEAS